MSARGRAGSPSRGGRTQRALRTWCREGRLTLLRRAAALGLALAALACPAPADAKLVLRDLVLHEVRNTKPDAILARMRLKPGDVVDYTVLKGAEEKLIASELFVSVRVWVDLPREQAVRKMYLEDAPEPVDVHVTAVEKVSWFVFPTGSLGGADKAAGLVYGDLNQDGYGRQVLAALQWGESKSYLVAGFRVPIVASAPFTYASSALFRFEDFRFYEGHRLVMHVPTRVIGGEAQVGWVVTPTVRAIVGAMYNRVDVYQRRFDATGAPALAYNPASGNLVVLQLYLLYDDTSAPEGLRTGTRISLRNEVSDRLWKSDFDYVKLDFQLELYARWGPVYPSMSVRSVINYPTSARGVPVTQLLRAGGPDLRGYLANEFRGDTLVVMQLEAQAPLFKGIALPLISSKLNIAGAVFLDTGALLERHPGGSAGTSTRDPVLGDFHTGLGAGLRLLVPGIAIPALKLDFGYGIDVKDYAITISIAGGGI